MGIGTVPILLIPVVVIVVFCNCFIFHKFDDLLVRFYVKINIFYRVNV